MLHLHRYRYIKHMDLGDRAVPREPQKKMVPIVGDAYMCNCCSIMTDSIPNQEQCIVGNIGCDMCSSPDAVLQSFW